MNTLLLIIVPIGLVGGVFLLSALSFFAVAGYKSIRYKLQHPQYMLMRGLPDHAVEEIGVWMEEQKTVKWLIAPFQALVVLSHRSKRED